MRFNAGRKRRTGEINITSLIDVMFLLVIFVLLAAKFEPEGGIAVELPTGSSSDAPKQEVQIISITAEGEIFLQKRQISFDTLGEEIRKMRDEFKDPVVVINADKKTPYEYVARATDIINTSGQSKFNLRIKP